MKKLILFFAAILLFTQCKKEETYNVTRVTELSGVYDVVIELHSNRDLITYYIGAESGTVQRNGYEKEREFFDTKYFTLTLDWDNQNFYVEVVGGNKLGGQEQDYIYALMSDNYNEVGNWGINTAKTVFEFEGNQDFWNEMDRDVGMFLKFPININ